jgi:hypothetical protein
MAAVPGVGARVDSGQALTVPDDRQCSRQDPEIPLSEADHGEARPTRPGLSFTAPGRPRRHRLRCSEDAQLIVLHGVRLGAEVGKRAWTSVIHRASWRIPVTPRIPLVSQTPGPTGTCGLHLFGSHS